MRRGQWWLAGVAATALLVGACDANDARQESTSSPAVTEQASSGSTASRSVADAAGQRAAPLAPGVSGGEPATNAAPLPATDRKIIFNVFLDLQMKDVQSGFERISQLAEANGGLVADSNVRQEGSERRATITVRVPTDRYQDVLGHIRGLAVKVDSERSTANDITEEFTDLQSRQRNLEATEQQLLVFLGQAKNVQEVLQVQDRLNSTRAEIERIKGRIAMLTRLSDLATIQTQLRPETAALTKASETGPLDALRSGWEASLAVVGGIAIALLATAAFSWWLLPLIPLAVWLLRREQRRRAEARPTPSTPTAAS